MTLLSTIQEVHTAQRRLNDAQDALRAHLQKPSPGPAEMAERIRLTAALQEAMNDYLRLVANLARS